MPTPTPSLSDGPAPTPVSPDADYVGKDELVMLAAMTNYANYVGYLLGGPLPVGGRIADFGAGLGAVADQLRTRHDVLCVELDPQLRRALEAKGYAVVATLDDVEANSLDAIVSSNVLEHIEDDVATLRLMYRSLRPGGVLALYLPAFPGLWTSFDDRVGHLRRYTRHTVSHAATTAGFHVRVTRYADSVGAVLAWTYRALGIGQGALKPWQVLFFDRAVVPMSRILDHVLGAWLGKNVLAVCVKPDA